MNSITWSGSRLVYISRSVVCLTDLLNSATVLVEFSHKLQIVPADVSLSAFDRAAQFVKCLCLIVCFICSVLCAFLFLCETRFSTKTVI